MARRNPDRTEYDAVILELFRMVYREGAETLPFAKDQLEEAAKRSGKPQKNLPDVLYTYRARRSLPQEILDLGHWIIDATAKSRYVFRRLRRSPYVNIPDRLNSIPIPEATPEIVESYIGADEQGMLARIRYNRLIDVFLSVVAFPLQSHFRTTVQGSQVEIDELYVGVDTNGQGFIIPVEAKGLSERDQIGIYQVSCMIRFAQERFPNLTLRPVAAKPTADGCICLVEFNTETDLDKIEVVQMKKYQLYREQSIR